MSTTTTTYAGSRGSVAQLENEFMTIYSDLDLIEQKLMTQFAKQQQEQLSHDSRVVAAMVSPLDLLRRIRSLQDSLREMEGDVTDILQAKREAIDITKNILLLSNRKLIVELTQDVSTPPSIDTKANEENFYQMSQQMMDQYNKWKYGVVEEEEDKMEE